MVKIVACIQLFRQKYVIYTVDRGPRLLYKESFDATGPKSLGNVTYHSVDQFVCMRAGDLM